MTTREPRYYVKPRVWPRIRRVYVERYEQGERTVVLAEELGVSPRWARRLLREAGAAMRPRGGPSREHPDVCRRCGAWAILDPDESWCTGCMAEASDPMLAMRGFYG